MSQVRLAFTPGSEWVYKQSNDATYRDIALPITQDYFDRRLYVLFSGGPTFLINATISLLLEGRKVYELPYIVASAAGGNTIFPGGGRLSTSNTIQSNSIEYLNTFGSFHIPYWGIMAKADTLKVQINSSTVDASATQFVGMQSQNIW